MKRVRLAALNDFAEWRLAARALLLMLSDASESRV